MYAAMLVPVAVGEGLEQRYQRFLLAKNKPAEDITTLIAKDMTQGVANLIIIKQALHAAGLPIEYKFINSPNAERGFWLVKEGNAVISSLTAYPETFNDDAYMSSVIIAPREIIKGIYGLPSNYELMNVTSLEQLQQFSAVIHMAWSQDIITLQKLQLNTLVLAHDYDSIFKQIKFRHIDFTLLDIPKRENKNRFLNGIELKLVPNVALELAGARHFIVSKKHANGTIVFNALEEGLKILRAKGLINKYYQEINLLQKKPQSWKILNAM